MKEGPALNHSSFLGTKDSGRCNELSVDVLIGKNGDLWKATTDDRK